MTDGVQRRPARSPAQAARDGMVLGLAVGASGLAFGAASVGSGLTVPQACVLSLLAYTGASQLSGLWPRCPRHGHAALAPATPLFTAAAAVRCPA